MTIKQYMQAKVHLLILASMAMFSSYIYAQVLTESSQKECSDLFLQDPPFFVSDVGSSKNLLKAELKCNKKQKTVLTKCDFQNHIEGTSDYLATQDAKISSYLPKGSLVSYDPDLVLDKKSEFIAVKIESVGSNSIDKVVRDQPKMSPEKMLVVTQEYLKPMYDELERINKELEIDIEQRTKVETNYLDKKNEMLDYLYELKGEEFKKELLLKAQAYKDAGSLLEKEMTKYKLKIEQNEKILLSHQTKHAKKKGAWVQKEEERLKKIIDEENRKYQLVQNVKEYYALEKKFPDIDNNLVNAKNKYNEAQKITAQAQKEFAISNQAIEKKRNLHNSTKGTLDKIVKSLKSNGLPERGIKRAEVGSKGLLPKSVLKDAKNYRFVVSSDALLISSEELKQFAGKILQLSMNDEGLFKVRRCCVQSKEDQKECVDNYYFDIYDGDSLIGSYLREGNDICSDLLQYSRPIKKELLTPFLKLLEFSKEVPNFKQSDALDLKILPQYAGMKDLMVMPINPETGEGPFNSYHYLPEGKKTKAADAMGNAGSLCVVNRVFEAFNKKCKGAGCQVQFGDIFYPHSVWEGPHSSHHKGTCIDIKPFRKNSDADVGINCKSAEYDNNKTQMFVDLLNEAEPIQILFNDTKMKHVKDYENHEHHIHVCFNPTSLKSQEICKNGFDLEKINWSPTYTHSSKNCKIY